MAPSSVPTSNLHRALEAAIGYLDLGMPADGLAELDALDPEGQAARETLELRAVLQQQLGNWAAAADAYGSLCCGPEPRIEHFIARGCCLYELGAVAACREALRTTPPSLSAGNGLWHFHLACYEALLGNREEAGRLARRCLEIEPGLRSLMARNRNLAPFLAAG